MLTQEKTIALISNRFLELIILPTEQCNFRCTYCYEDFLIGKMQKKTITAIKNFITERCKSLDYLKISWFGGEPLIARDIIYELSEFIHTIREKYPLLQYNSEITTNGFLLNPFVFKKLINYGITQYQISLDGTRETHDLTRKRLNGSGSFDTIWNNLIAMKKTDCEFSSILRLHITPTNIQDTYCLLNNINNTFSNDHRFAIFFKAIENLGGPHANNFTVLNAKDKDAILAELYHYSGNTLPIKNINDNGPYVCYAAQPNSLVIRANGIIGKCTVALQDNRNIVGTLLENGTLHIFADKMALWTRGIKSQRQEELLCPLMNLPTQTFHSIPIVVKE